MNPCRLIYRSIAEAKVLNSDSLAYLENQSANNNRRYGICGLLIVSDGRFLQVLEGIPKFVNRIYSKIIQDDRHHDVELIDYKDIIKPEFIDWSMKVVDLDDLDSNTRDLLEKKYPIKDGSFQIQGSSFLMTSLLIDVRHAFQ